MPRIGTVRQDVDPGASYSPVHPHGGHHVPDGGEPQELASFARQPRHRDDEAEATAVPRQVAAREGNYLPRLLSPWPSSLSSLSSRCFVLACCV